LRSNSFYSISTLSS